jgi:signal peptidase II
MYRGEEIPVIGNFFRITFIENPGMAFGFDPGINFKLLISIFSLVASIGLIIYLYYIRNKSLLLRVSIALIIGGAIGNLIDRSFYGIFYGYAPLFHGRVVDFLDFDFFHFTLFGRTFDRWPIFNIADSAVTIGVIILLLFYKQTNTQAVEEVKTKEIISEENVESSNKIPDEENHDDNNNNKTETDKDKLENGESDKGKEIPH